MFDNFATIIMKHRICPYCKTRVEYDDPKRAIVCPNCLAVIREDKRAIGNEGKCENYISRALEYVATGDMVKAFEWAVKATLIDSKNEKAKELKKNCGAYLTRVCKSYSEQKDSQSQFNDYFDRANNCFRKEEYDLALGYISLALEINPNEKNAKSIKNSIESILRMQFSSSSKPKKSHSNSPQKAKANHIDRVISKSEKTSAPESHGFSSSVVNLFAIWWPIIPIIIGLGLWLYFSPGSFLLIVIIGLILFC